MDRGDLDELHYITPISNLRSIRRVGILSHRRANGIEHASVAMPEIQKRRSGVVVPGGRPLHEYVNLYVCARNPMMYKRRQSHATLCVLRISTGVLDQPGVVIADGNASSDYVRFKAAPRGLAIVDKELVFSEYWTHQDEIEQWRHKRAKCAEVLVPDRVAPGLVMGVYLSSNDHGDLGWDIEVTIDPRLFFA